MPAALLALLEQLIPIAIANVPGMITSAETIINLIKSGSDPTPEQQAGIDSDLAAAHQALQAAIANKTN